MKHKFDLMCLEEEQSFTEIPTHSPNCLSIGTSHIRANSVAFVQFSCTNFTSTSALRDTSVELSQKKHVFHFIPKIFRLKWLLPVAMYCLPICSLPCNRYERQSVLSSFMRTRLGTENGRTQQIALPQLCNGMFNVYPENAKLTAKFE